MRLPSETKMALMERIYFYFLLVLSHSSVDRIITSMRTLRRHLKWMKLCRCKNQSDLLEVAFFLMEQLEGHRRLHGYKLQHLKCIQIGFVVSQRVVCNLLKLLKPLWNATEKEKSPKTSDLSQLPMTHGLLIVS